MVLKFMKNNKKVFLMFLFGFVFGMGVFAQSNTTANGESQMNSTIGRIVNFFNGGWVKGICCILLIGECLGLLFAGGQNPQIFKKFLPFIIGTVLFMCAGKIVNIIWGDNSSQFGKDIGLSYLYEKPEAPSLEFSAA